MYGHLFRDAVPERLLYSTAFPVCAWIERTNRPPRDQKGWLDGDAIAPTLTAVLRIMAEGVPMLLASVQATDQWAGEHAEPGEVVPPATGLPASAYRDVTITSAARAYTLWMVQRPLDAYRALEQAERARVDTMLEGTGWDALLAWEPRHRVVKRDYQVVWDRPAPA